MFGLPVSLSTDADFLELACSTAHLCTMWHLSFLSYAASADFSKGSISIILTIFFKKKKRGKEHLQTFLFQMIHTFYLLCSSILQTNNREVCMCVWQGVFKVDLQTVGHDVWKAWEKGGSALLRAKEYGRN